MEQVFSQLGQLFVQTIPTIILVTLLVVILNWLFFRPLSRTLDEREAATVGALGRAREQTAAAEEKARQYEAALQAARQEVYRRREADRRAALDQRDIALAKARQEAQALVAEAKRSVALEVEAARRELRTASQPLALEITERLLSEGTPGRDEGSVAP